MEHLGNIILIALFCVGWYMLLSKGMLLEALGKKLEKLPKMIYKPLGGCLPCSASLVGLTAYSLLFFIPYGHIVVYLVIAVSFNEVIWGVRDLLFWKIEDIKYTIALKKLQKTQKLRQLRIENKLKRKDSGDGTENHVESSEA